MTERHYGKDVKEGDTISFRTRDPELIKKFNLVLHATGLTRNELCALAIEAGLKSAAEGVMRTRLEALRQLDDAKVVGPAVEAKLEERIQEIKGKRRVPSGKE